jgi:UDP-3-O-[3-hydroxymyristoyl] glucosamine N-acyltransferase
METTSNKKPEETRFATPGKALSIKVPKGKTIYESLRELRSEVKVVYVAENDSGKQRTFRRHSNPGSDTASGGWVESSAIIGENAHLGNNVIVADRAIVSDGVILIGEVIIEKNACVAPSARLIGILRVTDDAWIGENTELQGRLEEISLGTPGKPFMKNTNTIGGRTTVDTKTIIRS